MRLEIRPDSQYVIDSLRINIRNKLVERDYTGHAEKFCIVYLASSNKYSRKRYESTSLHKNQPVSMQKKGT